MSDEETEAILRTIEDCSEHTQCGVDDVSSLLYELKQQEKEMTARLDTIAQVIQQLKELNETTEPENRDEVRAFVRDMLRWLPRSVRYSLRSCGRYGSVF